jgi:hypothetical protein
MPTRPLPNDPSLEHLRKHAKRLHHSVRAGDADALGQVRDFHPRGGQAVASERKRVVRMMGLDSSLDATWPLAV